MSDDKVFTSGTEQCFAEIAKAVSGSILEPIEKRQKAIDLLTPLCDDLDAHMNFMRGNAESILRDGESICPAYCFLSKSGISCPVVMPSLPESRKDIFEFLSSMLAMMSTVPIDAYSFICETWIAAVDKETDLSKMRPSKHPDRKEAVLIRVSNHNDSRIGVFEIVTDNVGHRSLSENSMIPEGAEDYAPNILMSDFIAMWKSAKKYIEKKIHFTAGNEVIH